MNVHLMYAGRDFDAGSALPPNAAALTDDLGLGIIFRAMAGEDALVLDVVRKAILSAPQNDVRTILHRQAVLRDCLANPRVVRDLYDLAGEALEAERRDRFFGFLETLPDMILSGSVKVLELFVERFRKLRNIAAAQAAGFDSTGFANLFATIRRELSGEYLAEVEHFLRELRWRGALMSAELGTGNRGRDYVLRVPPRQPSWWERLHELLFGPRVPEHRFWIAERDEAGARALTELKGRGLNGVANVLAQSTDHVHAFFLRLRTELAFYLGCMRLHDRLAGRGKPVCFPAPELRKRSCRAAGIYDVALALSTDREIVGNAFDADGKDLVVITGANQGGKSSLLRAVGLAQLMMHTGMFVGAESFEAEPCTGLFTHFKREEDANMKSGKLDEELQRMSEVVNDLSPGAVVLLNESFAATNEREGSEIAGQIVRALRENGVRVWFVTHLYEFARAAFEANDGAAMFLRPERNPDGTRTFRLRPAEPKETSHGEDVYRTVFGPEDQEFGAARNAQAQPIA